MDAAEGGMRGALCVYICVCGWGWLLLLSIALFPANGVPSRVAISVT